MKKSVLVLFLIIVSIFMFSCKKDEPVIVESGVKIVATDNPPGELLHADGDYLNYSVYFTMNELNGMDLSSPMKITNWLIDEKGNQYSKNEIRHKIRGRTYYGLYRGSVYIASSFTDFAVNMDILSRLTFDVKKYDYALGRRCPDSSTKYGLTIYDVFRE